LEVTDIMADMQVHDISMHMDDERGIFIHIIKENEDFRKKERSSQIYRAMGNTAWGRMAFDNEFAYNDLSNIGRKQMKQYKPVTGFIYKTHKWYVYMKEGQYFLTSSPNNIVELYDLNKENDQKRFWFDHGYDLRNECIEGNMTFSTYSMYDLIVNYRKIFNVN